MRWKQQAESVSSKGDGTLKKRAAIPAPHRTAFILLGLAGATVTAFGIAAISDVFSSVFLALVLTICVSPLRRTLERRGVPRSIATVSVLVAVVGLLGGFVVALVISFAQFATLLPDYAPQFEAWAAAVGSWLAGLGIGADEVAALLGSFEPAGIVGAIGGIVGGVLGGAAGFLSGAVVLLTLLILMAVDSSYVPALVAGLRPARPDLADALVRFASGVRRYMVATTGLGLVQGLINWAALAIMGIPGALLWGMLSFLCSFIPNVGYFIALIPPLVFGALVGGWPTVIAVVVVYGLINAAIQSVIQPKIVGNAVSLSQTLTFVSVIFWAILLGPMGAILAIPLTLLVRMLLVDSNPGVAWVRPALGEFEEARHRMAIETAAAAERRRAARAARSRPNANSA